jgi:hypothetical protein
MYLAVISDFRVRSRLRGATGPVGPCRWRYSGGCAGCGQAFRSVRVGEITPGTGLAQPRPDARRWDEVGRRAGSGPGPAQRGGSRPISRVLSWATIPLGRTSPCASSDLPGSPCGPQERARRLARFPIWSCSRWGLPCRRMLPPARCALTAPFHPCRPQHLPRGRGCGLGGLLSVALSVGSRPPGVTWHLALWSPDFPPRPRTQRLPGRLPCQVYRPRNRGHSPVSRKQVNVP